MVFSATELTQSGLIPNLNKCFLNLQCPATVITQFGCLIPFRRIKLLNPLYRKILVLSISLKLICLLIRVISHIIGDIKQNLILLSPSQAVPYNSQFNLKIVDCLNGGYICQLVWLYRVHWNVYTNVFQYVCLVGFLFTTHRLIILTWSA